MLSSLKVKSTPVRFSVTGTGQFDRMRQLDITVQANVSAVAEDVTDTNVVLKDADGAVTGMAATDANGVANDLNFVTQTVDADACSNVCTANLAGYQAVTVASIEVHLDRNFIHEHSRLPLRLPRLGADRCRRKCRYDVP